MAAKMTKERVMEQAAGNAIAFLAGLVVLWFWRPPTSAPVLAALLVGLAVAVPVDVAIDSFVFKRNLREQFGLRGLNRRPVASRSRSGTRVVHVMAKSSKVYDRLTQKPSASRAASVSSSSARVFAAGNVTP